MIKPFIKPLSDRFKFILDDADITELVDSVTLSTDKNVYYAFKVYFKNGDVDCYPHHRFVVEVLPSESGVEFE